MIIGIIKEPAEEKRVSLLPEAMGLLQKKGGTIYVEQQAGAGAAAADNLYKEKGAVIVDRNKLLLESDVLLSMHPLSPAELMLCKPAVVLIGVYQPLFQQKWSANCAARQHTVFSMDMLPRTTRAQSMDVLSSQANIAGYKAVLTAANMYTRYFPMFMTAAGSIPPAKVLILGAGVAGLQAIATAKRLGAVVEVFDTRPAVKEEVNSLGAKFIEVEGAADASKAGGYAVEQSIEYQQKQQQRIAESAAKADVIITTAQIPGRTAPILINDDILLKMKPGSVIIDLAASTGGNTSRTKNLETVWFNEVTIYGNSNLASTVPSDASKMYGKNIVNFLTLIINAEGSLSINFDDDLVKGSCIIYDGKLVHERLLSL
jgi:NAD(P) transhydrogenase subunit alpha